MNVVAKLGLELVNELGDDVQQILCRSVFIQRSQLANGFFRAGLAAGQQIGNGTVALCVPILGIAFILPFDKRRVVGFIESPFHIRKGRGQIIRVGWSENRAEAVEAVPVDVALGAFLIDVFAVGKVETPVIVLGVIGAMGSGSSVVSCQFQIDIPPFQHLGGENAAAKLLNLPPFCAR